LHAPASQRNCCRFLGFYSPAAFFSSGSVERCGASFKRHQKISKKGTRRWWRMRQDATEQWQGAAYGVGTHIVNFLDRSEERDRRNSQ
jgi:hypothetical protein